MTRLSMSARKAEACAEIAKEKAESAEQERLYRKCFWTWPWGHKWKMTNWEYCSTYECRVCGKEV
jgi:hypothetical protein